MTTTDRPAGKAHGGAPSREDRLAKALRENLKRRKAPSSVPPPAAQKDPG